VYVDVFRTLLAVLRAIRRHANPLGTRPSGGYDRPAVIWKTNLDLLPQGGVLRFVVHVQVVNIKSAHVGKNFFGTVITPMPSGIPNYMPMGAWIPKVIPIIF
jgi:hypothetical protein